MNIKEFAAMLNGRSYGLEITSEENKLAIKLGFVVVYGYSDDNMILAGAIDEEVSCYDGGICYLNQDGLFEHCDFECKHSEDAKKLTKQITAIWHDEGKYTWTYDTDIPHEKFDIYEDKELRCQGIIFDLNRLEKDGGVDAML